MYGDPYSDPYSSGFGGLGSTLQGYASNPFILAGLQMLGNNTPQIGKIPNTFQGVPNVLLAASAEQRRNEAELGKISAMSAALQDAGMSAGQANTFARNPQAAALALDQLQQRKITAEGQNFFGQPEPGSPATPYSPGPAAPTPGITQTLPPGPVQYDPKVGLTQTPAQPQRAAPQITSEQGGEGDNPDRQPSAIDNASSGYDKFALATVNKTVAEAAANVSGGNQTTQSQFMGIAKSLGLSPDSKITGQMLSDPAIARQLAKVAGVGADLPDDQWTQAHDAALQRSRARQAAAAQGQQGQGETVGGPPDMSNLPNVQQPGAPQPQMRNMPYAAPQPGAPQPQMQPLAQGAQAAPEQAAPETATDRALAVREQQRVDELNAKIAYNEKFLGSKNPNVAKTAAERIQAYRKELEDKPEFKKLRTNPLTGEETYGWVDRRNRTISEYKPPKAFGGGDASLESIATAVDNARASGETDTNKLAELIPDRGLKSYTQALLKGDAVPGNLGNRAGPIRASALQLAHIIDPNFNESQIQLRQSFARNMASSAPNSWGSQKRSAETIVEHQGSGLDNLAVLEKGAKGIGASYGEQPELNRMRYFLNRRAGDENYNKANGGYEVDRKAVADEVVRLLTGGQGSERDRATWVDRFDLSTHSLSEVKGAWNEAFNIMHGRLSAIASQKEDAWNTPTTPESLLPARLQPIMLRIREGASSGTAGGPPQQEAPRAPTGTRRGGAALPGGTTSSGVKWSVE